MKNFFTSMLGALVALIIFSVGSVVLCIGFIAMMAAVGGEKKPSTVENGSFLVFDLAVNITDTPPQFDSSALTEAFGGNSEPKTLQLRQVTRALHAAARDSRISGIFLTGQLSPEGYGNGFAALKEVRAALEEFKATGKPVIAYLDYVTTRDYYLASLASDLALDPYGLIIMPGLASEPVFFTGAFEKFGIGVQVTRVGKYKSYIEPYTRKDMSPENRAQTQKLLDDLWGEMVAEASASRGIKPADLQAVVDAEGLIRPDPAVKAKLVSRTAYRDQIIDELKARTGRTGSKKTFKQLTLADYAKTIPSDDVPDRKKGDDSDKKTRGGGRIAIVYTEGDIIDGEGDLGQVGGTKFARELRRLRQDDDVKAVVLRVNSPGGSASAAEEIRREVWLTRKVKPVVVSMGTYAASGGYWISAYGDRIFAEPTTITGSIGVFGMQFNIQKLANNLGFTFDTVKTGKFADLITISRPKTDEELAIFQRMVDWTYQEFIKKVADARGIDPEKVNEIAQGRVWSGAEAKNLGLVDELGGLEDAIAYAADKVGLGTNYHVSEFPGRKDWQEFLADAFDNFKPMSSRQSGILGQFTRQLKTEAKVLEQYNDPRGIYARLEVNIQPK